ncbi:MAG: metal-dependent transcriptional regulator [Flavobacteriales bacterium]|nr:metal-dependent transcriptional regulator [Flavobacteriales bacterium]
MQIISNSFTEENYLKAIHKLSRKNPTGVSTNSIAEVMETKASSVTDMVKKLAVKKLINYKKYQGVTLTEKGRKAAVSVVRKHRLWEVFLVHSLGFKWDNVHEIAEELEHVQSDELVDKLDKYLGFPKYDPHGDPIPDSEGNITYHKDMCLSDLDPSEAGVVVGVKDSSSSFLQYIEKMKLILGAKVRVEEIIDFDRSMSISINGKLVGSISESVAKNLYIKRT